MARRTSARNTRRPRPPTTGQRLRRFIHQTAAATGALLARRRMEVKFLSALLLLPVCWITSAAVLALFTRATLHGHFWATEEFWFFTLGVLLWLIAFFGLPPPILLYVFGHELTHALWVWLHGGRIQRFHVTSRGGYILSNKTNFLIALAPYFFPIYSIAVICLHGILRLFIDTAPYARILFALLGVTWAFHFTFTCWMIPKGQTDLSENGTFFSLVIIYLLNLLVLAFFLVAASPDVTAAQLATEWLFQARLLLTTLARP